jgi:hypothetical protein
LFIDCAIWQTFSNLPGILGLPLPHRPQDLNNSSFQA